MREAILIAFDPDHLTADKYNRLITAIGAWIDDLARSEGGCQGVELITPSGWTLDRETNPYRTETRSETMNDAERYAINRIEDLTKAIAGCLTPATLRDVIDDIGANTPYPVPEDLARFASRMATQLSTLAD